MDSIDHNNGSRIAADREGLSSKELFLLFRESGDRTAFEMLVVRHRDVLARNLKWLMRDSSMADEAVQMAFLDLFKNPGNFDCSKDFEPFMRGVVRHRAQDLVRSEKRRKMREAAESLLLCHGGDGEEIIQKDPKETDIADEVGDREAKALMREKVREAVAQLPQKLRCVMQLIFVQGLSYKAAAERLNLPLGTVKNNVHVAKQLLQETCSLRDCYNESV